jgi:NAD(P)-dependent dehydrogenase (short-subunit alcohol dehydrogenase family)
VTQTHVGRVAVITGAAGSLGCHFAEHLAELGCDLAIADYSNLEATVAAVKKFGVNVYAESFDLGDAEAVQTFSENVLNEFGRCDILINNAAHMPLVPLSELSLTEFRKFERVNIEAALLLAQAFAPSMVKQKWGRIVQIASSTVGTPMPGFTGYITTKMAGIGMVRALAAEFGVHGITVNAVSPGLTRTPASEKNIPAELFEQVRNQQLIKRTEVPSDLCGMIGFITSDAAGMISGQVLNVDGGSVL